MTTATTTTTTTHRIIRATVRSSDGDTPSGLKGWVGTEEYAGVDVFVGPNGSGKTTRAVHVLLAAMQGLDTTPTGTGLYLSRPEHTAIQVDVQTPAGVEHVDRDLGAIRGRVYQQQSAVASKMLGCPPVAWDLSDFAAATPNQRASVLDAVARAGGAIERWTAQQAQARVRSLLVAEVDGDETDTAWLAPYDLLLASLTSARDGEGWLQYALDWATGQQTATNTEQRQREAHAAQQTADLPPVVAGDAEADLARRDELLDAAARRRSAAQTAAAARAAAAQHAAQGERLRAALSDVMTEGQRLAIPTQSPDLTTPPEVIARVDAARAAITEPIPPVDSDSDRLTRCRAGVESAEAAVQSAEAALATATEAAASAAAAVIDAEADIAPHREAMLTAQSAVEHARAALDALRDLSGADAVCVHCGEADPLGIAGRIQAAETGRDAATATLVEAQGRLVEAQGRLDTAQAQADTAEQARIERARHRMDAVRELSLTATRLEDAKRAPGAHIASIRMQREGELDAAGRALAAEQARIERARQRWAMDEQRRQAALTRARARWSAASAALQQWERTEPPTVPEPDGAEAADAEVSELAQIEQRIRLRTIRADRIRQAEQAQAAYETARREWDATRALLRAVRQARDELAAAAYLPIQTAARALLADAGPDLPVPYFAGPADYGAITRGGRVPYHDLSQAEALLVAAALVYAFAAISRQPCRLVMLDGFEVVQADHRSALLAALARAHCAGVVDNVTVTISTPDPEADPDAYERTVAPSREIAGVTVHELTLPPAVVVALDDEPAMPQPQITEPQHEPSTQEIAGDLIPF